MHATAGELNPQISKADLGLDETLLMCHSGLPPPSQGVYKKPREDLSRSVLIQVERSPLVRQHHPRNNASRGRSPSVENTSLESPHDPRASPYRWPQPFPCIEHYLPPSASTALFYVSNSSGTTIFTSSPPWFPSSHVATICSNPFS